jgi:hypothetical protein
MSLSPDNTGTFVKITDVFAVLVSGPRLDATIIMFVCDAYQASVRETAAAFLSGAM